MITSDVNSSDLKLNNPNTLVYVMPDVEGIRKETTAQSSRLYAANYLSEDDLIMTCDMDLLPLSDYWHPSSDNITVYGHDLTWFSYFPMGYCAMTGKKWKQKLQLTGDTKADMERDFKEVKIAYSGDWEKWWNHDWQLLTNRLMPFKDELTMINRGQINIAGATLAKGRIDRFNFMETQNQPEPFIDAHCENNNVQHPVKLEPFLKMYEKYVGKL